MPVAVSLGACRATASVYFLTWLNLALVSLLLHYPVPNGLASSGGAEETAQEEMKADLLLILLIQEFVSSMWWTRSMPDHGLGLPCTTHLYYCPTHVTWPFAFWH